MRDEATKNILSKNPGKSACFGDSYRGWLQIADAPRGIRGEHMDLFAPSHLLLLLLVILVIFGPSKLGDVGGALGKGIRDFKRAINEPDNNSEEPR